MWIGKELERSDQAQSSYYPSIQVEKLKETVRNISQCKSRTGLKLKLTPLE
jgi:hypothetical protein